MATLNDQIDRFVRWFFNSSPDQISIEPQRRDAEPSKPKTRVPARSGGAGKRRPPMERRSSARNGVRVQA